MSLTIRAIDPSEVEAFRAAMGLCFGFDPVPDRLTHFEKLFEADRSRCAFDDGHLVGTAGAFSLDMTVPGATVRCGGTTMVSVLPTHRRRGVLRKMMGAHLDDVREREEPIAALWASESSIYGRFGFGQASVELDVTIPREHVRFHRLAPEPDPVRIVSAEEARRLVQPVFEAVRMRTPGFYARTEDWWSERFFFDPPDRREGATSYRYAVAFRGRRPVGYAQYRFRGTWEGHHGRGKVQWRNC